MNIEYSQLMNLLYVLCYCKLQHALETYALIVQSFLE